MEQCISDEVLCEIEEMLKSVMPAATIELLLTNNSHLLEPEISSMATTWSEANLEFMRSQPLTKSEYGAFLRMIELSDCPQKLANTIAKYNSLLSHHDDIKLALVRKAKELLS